MSSHTTTQHIDPQYFIMNIDSNLARNLKMVQTSVSCLRKQV
ncbi:MAG: hypothetical protein K0Q95_229 [Bacteroidota bacterium]|jgi:hypothetical protein|nr:hypothetical protein [Bacteroidota bacterium]